MNINGNMWITAQCPHCRRWFVICVNPQNYTPTEVAKLREDCPYCSKRKNERVMTIKDYKKNI